MVSAENRRGLYVVIPVYFAILAGCAVYANRRMSSIRKRSNAMATHYLGGRDFGFVLSAGTFFATVFSGYTIIGVPVR